MYGMYNRFILLKIYFFKESIFCEYSSLKKIHLQKRTKLNEKGK